MGSVTLDANREAALGPPFTYNSDNVEKFAKLF
jgi:rhamnose transport system substrate-binding protein